MHAVAIMHRVRRVYSAVRIASFLFVMSLLPAVGRAESGCPWLNAATAAGFLGGDVNASVTPYVHLGDATCEFTHTGKGNASLLRIAVHTMKSPAGEMPSYYAQCSGVRTPMIAIGNEAAQCVGASGGKANEELIVGRVRERAFVITIHFATPPTDAMRDEARNVAEQVAGSLF